MSWTHPNALTRQSLDAAIERGLIRIKNPELPFDEEREKQAERARKCMARLRAERAGKNIKNFPKRVRPSYLLTRKQRQSLRYRKAMRNKLLLAGLSKNGSPRQRPLTKTQRYRLAALKSFYERSSKTIT